MAQESGPSTLDMLEAWRNKCSSTSNQSNDALVPVVTKALELMSTVIKPDGSRNEFTRSLSSMALECTNSQNFDPRKNVGVRDLTYGLLECFRRTLLELDRNGWQPGWDRPTLRVKQEPREPEEQGELLFAHPIEVKTERGDGGDEVARRNRTTRRNSESSPFILDDFGTGGADDDVARGSRSMMTNRRRSSSRAMSPPAEDDENGGRVVKKRRAPTGKRGTLGCVYCEWHQGNSPGTVISHLRVHHGETPSSSGCYFRCKCGFESRSNNHAKNCGDAKFTLVKDEDEPFRPKRSNAKNQQRKDKGKDSNEDN
ncbi:hypothetical protein PMAYCL1PPCAC_01989 [Pristionchus mayeri]|uniref:Uncharacterized protein n=1 Tax=Pristionchus mayeri TaxID=1317129 RepID=A0AAN4Z1X5_9BILA|nr:hypothetical protein PMAYCL1PPCAC_01989 [Pristionchus mayeri]